MRMMLVATGTLLLLAGTIWLLQGLDVAIAPQSPMTGDRTWVVLGALAVLSGGGMMWAGRRR
ncbi:MAG TPA: hypothetical protein VGC03_06025 [Acidimicrobiia bacterium]|jgi:hypothetical protein